jgi:hypothetical protein
MYWLEKFGIGCFLQIYSMNKKLKKYIVF